MHIYITNNSKCQTKTIPSFPQSLPSPSKKQHLIAQFVGQASSHLIVAQKALPRPIPFLLLDHLIEEIHPLLRLLICQLRLEVILVLPRSVDLATARQIVVTPFEQFADGEQTRRSHQQPIGQHDDCFILVLGNEVVEEDSEVGIGADAEEVGLAVDEFALLAGDLVVFFEDFEEIEDGDSQEDEDVDLSFVARVGDEVAEDGFALEIGGLDDGDGCEEDRVGEFEENIEDEFEGVAGDRFSREAVEEILVLDVLLSLLLQFFDHQLLRYPYSIQQINYYSLNMVQYIWVLKWGLLWGNGGCSNYKHLTKIGVIINSNSNLTPMNPQEKSKSKQHLLAKSLSKKSKSSATLHLEKQAVERPVSEEEMLDKLIANLCMRVQKGGEEMEPHRVAGMLREMGSLCDSKKPAESLKSYLKIYTRVKSVYFLPIEGECRLIFRFFRSIVHHYEQFPLYQLEKVAIIYEYFEQWLTRREDCINQEEMKMMEQINAEVWLFLGRGDRDRILELTQQLIFKIPGLLGRGKWEQQIEFAQNFISSILKSVIIFVKNSNHLPPSLLDSITHFYQHSFDLLISISRKPSQTLPLFDIAAMAFCSKYGEVFKKIVMYTFAALKLSLEDKKDDPMEMENAKEGKEIDDESKVRATLLAASIFTFHSQIEQPNHPAIYKKQILFLTLINFKPQLIRLIDEIQKIDKLAIHPSIIRGMFQMATFGTMISTDKTLLNQIVNKISSTKEFSLHLPKIDKNNSSQNTAHNNLPNQDGQIQQMKIIEKTMFELLYRIEKSLSTYSLDIFMDLYIEYPLTFRRDYFIDSLFQNQHEELVLKFMIDFSAKWLNDQKKFDYFFYLQHFFNKCIKEDKISFIGRFIKLISVEELLRINLYIYKLSFEDEKKKFIIPEASIYDVRLASVTSCGYADRYGVINKILPQFSEQLLWKQLIQYICPSHHYLTIKTFYHVVNHQFTLSKQNEEKIDNLMRCLETSLNQELMEQAFSTFHLLNCILTRRKSAMERDADVIRKFERKIMKIIVEKHHVIMHLYELVCERRRVAMNHVVMSHEMVSENLKYLQRAKRMNHNFLRSMLKIIENIPNLNQVVDTSFQRIVDLIFALNKDYEFMEFHSIRVLSEYCSQKYFSNLMVAKFHNRIQTRDITADSLLILKEIMNVYIQKYPEQSKESHQFTVKQVDIIRYYARTLSTKVQIINDKDLLRNKLIVLESLFEIKNFLEKERMNPNYKEFIEQFNGIYTNKIKPILIEIARQNPQYVSKYERELIMHLRIQTISEILKSYRTSYEIMPQSELYAFMYEICFDKNEEIRFFVVNVIVSRFKSEIYKAFLHDKYSLMVYATVISIFEPLTYLKIVTTKIVEAYKSAGEDECCLGLTILLYSLKYIFTYFRNNISKQEYSINLDFFISNFDKIWLIKKEWQFFSYIFATKFIEEKRFYFIIEQIKFNNPIQVYFYKRERSDFLMEKEIKQYFNKDLEFSFEFPPEEGAPNSKDRLIDNLIKSLPLRAFTKLKQLISDKAKHPRILRSKKQAIIDWSLLQKRKILKFTSQPISQRDIVSLTI